MPDLIAESASAVESEGISAGATDFDTQCKYAHIDIRAFLIRALGMRRKKKSEETMQEIDIYDRVLGRFQGSSYADLGQYLDDHPLQNPRAVVDELLYDIPAWSQRMRAMDVLKTRICQYPGQLVSTGDTFGAGSDGISWTNTTTASNRSSAIFPRHFFSDPKAPDIPPAPNDGVPTFGTIFRGIINGEISIRHHLSPVLRR